MALVEIDRNPPARQLRWYGLSMVAFFLIIGALLHFQFGLPRAARVVWLLGGAVGLLFYAVPALRLALYLTWIQAVYPIGFVVSGLVLAVSYYIVLTPIGLCLRIFRRDALQRRFDSDAESYWREHRTGGEPSQYFRQY